MASIPKCCAKIAQLGEHYPENLKACGSIPGLVLATDGIRFGAHHLLGHPPHNTAILGKFTFSCPSFWGDKMNAGSFANAQTFVHHSLTLSLSVCLSGGSHTGAVPVVDLLHKLCVSLHRYLRVGTVHKQCVSLHAGLYRGHIRLQR